MSIDSNNVMPSREELHALVDDELDAARVEAIDRWASQSTENASHLQAEVSAIRDLKQALSTLPASPVGESDLERQLLLPAPGSSATTAAPQPEPQNQPEPGSTPDVASSQRWWLPALAAMLVLGVGAGYILGQSTQAVDTYASSHTTPNQLSATWLDSEHPVPRWISQAANYQAMYVTDTLVHSNTETVPALQLEQRLSAALGADVRVPVLPASLQFKRGQVLESGGQPVIQLAWLHDNGEPVAVCVTAAGTTDSNNSAVDLQSGQLQQLRFVVWRQAGLEYVIMGRFEHARLRDWATAVRQDLET